MMKKLTKLCLMAVLTLILGLSVGLGITGAPAAMAEETKTEVSVTGIQKRGNQLLIFLSSSDYTTDSVGTKKDGLNLLESIKIYTAPSESVTLKTAWEAEGSSQENYFNVWGEQNSICFAMGSAYSGKAIYAIKIPKGTEFPSQTGGAGYVTVADAVYYNNNYNTDQIVNDSDWYVSWGTESSSPIDPVAPDTDIPKEEVAVTGIHKRGNELLIFLSDSDYTTGNDPVGTRIDGLNLLDQILIYTTKNSYVTLKTAWEAVGINKENYFYLWGEKNTITFAMGNAYAGQNIYAVKIPAGTEFPSQNGGAGYVTTADVTYYNADHGVSSGSEDFYVTWKTEAPAAELVYKTNVNAVHFRDNRMILKLTQSNYAKDGASLVNEAVTADQINASGLLEGVKIYTSQSEYKTLGEVFTAGTHEAWFNLYGETPSVAFSLAHEYTGDEIYAVEIAADCALPSYYAEETIETKDGAYYKNNEYGTVKAEAWFVDWVLQLPEEADTEITLKNEIHIRADVNEAGEYATVKMYFFLQGVDYQDYAGGNEPVVSSGKTYADLTDFNTLDNILLWTSETEYITLRQAHYNEVDENRPATHEVYFNLFGEKNTIVFDISGYNGLSFVKITVLGGCEFPSARGLKGMINADKAYVNTETINYIDWLRDETFSTNWRIDNNVGNTEISSVGVNTDDSVLYFGLTENDYPGEDSLKINANAIEEAIQGFYSNVLIDGVLFEDFYLSDAVTSNGDSYYNYGGKGVFGIELPSYDVSKINKVIFLKGTRIPTYVNTEIGIAGYGVMYYTLSESVMFVKNSEGVFVKAEKLLWTVDFGGQETKEVADGEAIGALPTAEKEGYKFVGWYNGQQKMTEETLVNGDLALEAKYVKVYTVTFNTDGADLIASQTVEEGELFTAPEAPVKEGYVFLGWYDGETEYDFTTAPTADVTLTAKWELEAADCSNCSAGMGISAMAALLLLPFAAKLLKKKEN